MVAACLGATAAVGTASAAAATAPGENIYGMGSSLQGVAQTDQGVTGVGSTGGACGSTGWLGWVAVWRCTPADQSQLSNPGVSATYTVESSGVGLAEFGDAASTSCPSTTGVLSPACDPTAGPKGELDSFIGTDDPPNSTQLANGNGAAGGGVQQLTIPVTQAPVALILSFPTTFTVGTGSDVKITSQEVANIWSQTLPAQSACPSDPGNTWCDLLVADGFKRITSGTPKAFQFLDTSSNDGGSITLQARSKGSGTTFSFRGYLYELDKYGQTTLYPYGLVTDGPSDWPVTVTETNNTSGSALVTDTTDTPGSFGYANMADAALASPAYTSHVTTVSDGGTHQILYALVQNNTGDGAAPVYESPSNSIGTVNLYTGANVGMNVTTCAAPSTARVVGCWVVPSSPTGAWSSSSESTPGTIPSDADVDDHGTNSAGTHSKNYPIVAATYDVAWTDYDNGSSNLHTLFNDASCPSGTNCAGDAGLATASSMHYVTGSGQSNLASGKVYYGALPSAIKTKAIAAAKLITP